MIELRWIWRDVEINDDVGYKERFLQYRHPTEQRYDEISCGWVGNWIDVPEVEE